MILGIKIGVGIVLGIVFLNLAFWAVIILAYLILTLFEFILKWIVRIIK
jgi:hypothetical protein